MGIFQTGWPVNGKMNVKFVAQNSNIIPFDIKAIAIGRVPNIVSRVHFVVHSDRSLHPRAPSNQSRSSFRRAFLRAACQARSVSSLSVKSTSCVRPAGRADELCRRGAADLFFSIYLAEGWDGVRIYIFFCVVTEKTVIILGQRSLAHLHDACKTPVMSGLRYSLKIKYTALGKKKNGTANVN